MAGFDTELFGHWWHEGPAWLAEVLRLLPEAGVEVTTLAGAREAGYVADAVRLEAGSWGSGKDWRVWAGGRWPTWSRTTTAWCGAGGRCPGRRAAGPGRDQLADQIAREALLALSSDWAFMITKDSAAEYARARHDLHHRRFDELVRVREEEPSKGRRRSPLPWRRLGRGTASSGTWTAARSGSAERLDRVGALTGGLSYWRVTLPLNGAVRAGERGRVPGLD